MGTTSTRVTIVGGLIYEGRVNKFINQNHSLINLCKKENKNSFCAGKKMQIMLNNTCNVQTFKVSLETEATQATFKQISSTRNNNHY